MYKKHVAFALILAAVLTAFCLFVGGCSGGDDKDDNNSSGKTGTLYFVSTRDSDNGYNALVYSGEVDFGDETLNNVKAIVGTDYFGLYNDLFVVPNGNTMFCSMTQGSLLYSDIRKIDISSGSLETLTDSEQANNIAPVFTTSHKVYYTSNIRDTGVSQIRSMNSDGTGNTSVFEIPEGTLTTIGLSPDENSLCLSVIDSNQNYDIYRFDLSAGTYINLTNTPDVSEWSPNYAPDGTIIYVTKPYDNSDQTEIFRMDDDGNNVTQITGGEENFNGPLWQYDKWIAFQSGDDIWLYNIEEQTVSNLTGSQGSNYSHTLWVEE